MCERLYMNDCDSHNKGPTAYPGFILPPANIYRTNAYVCDFKFSLVTNVKLPLLSKQMLGEHR